MMPIFMIIALDIIITLRFSINCPAAIFSPTVLFSILREASSETYGLRVYLPSYKFPIYNISFRSTILQYFTFRSINQKYQKYFFSDYPSILYLTLQITMKGLTTPFSRWLQVGVCLRRYSVACRFVSYWIDTLVLKTDGNTYATVMNHAFLFKGKTNAVLKR